MQLDRTNLKLNEEQIIWPNGLNRKPDGIRTRKNVSVRIFYFIYFF